MVIGGAVMGPFLLFGLILLLAYSFDSEEGGDVI
jgi:hypothetical protein